MYLALRKSAVSIMMLVSIGIYSLGLVFLFDRFFLILGNILFLASAGYSAGLGTLLLFFIKPSKLKGSCFYFSGSLLLLIGWSLIGGVIQSIGVFYLFRDFIPQIYASSKYIPGIGPLICSSAFLKKVVEKISGSAKENVV